MAQLETSMSYSQADEGLADARVVWRLPETWSAGDLAAEGCQIGDTSMPAFCFFSMLAREPLSLRAGAGVAGRPSRLPGQPRCCCCCSFGVAPAAKLSV